MIVGAGLIFMLMHGEVSAEEEPKKPEPSVCSIKDTKVPFRHEGNTYRLFHCETSKLVCGLVSVGLSCVKKGMFK